MRRYRYWPSKVGGEHEGRRGYAHLLAGATLDRFQGRTVIRHPRLALGAPRRLADSVEL